ncbi:MAG: hypothetical protein CSA62_11730 [Planctomycetota bacterium]|nr:MAG: hypothetical protein CSA62_11730 [Planctomycetota bacterium]
MLRKLLLAAATLLLAALSAAPAMASHLLLPQEVALAQQQAQKAAPKADKAAQAADQIKTYGNRLGEGLGRAGMWPAPSAADWKKPVPIRWQRSWADAVATAKRTGKAILICINMDGEPASEHYAGIRYRDPEIAKLYEKYVCVIASVYRHNPRDYDEKGRRIPCPRFGHVTCGEHIHIEPLLFEKFMEGRRIAPRHIMVELDGSETYDVMLTNDTASVFDKVQEGILQRDPSLLRKVRGDRSIFEKIASRDAADRAAVEKAFLGGDKNTKRKLLEAARANKAAAPVDLLRLGLFSLDSELNKKARAALIESESPQAVDLISEALRAPISAEERSKLIETLTRIGAVSAKAKTLSVVHKGMTSKSKTVDVENWATAVAGGSYPAPKTRLDLSKRISEVDSRVAEAPQDKAALIELARSSLAIAVHPKTAPKWVKPHLADAILAGLKAEKLGAKGWPVDATLAVAYWYSGQKLQAFERASKAMQALPDDPKSWNSMAVLDIFVQSRRKQIRDAYIAKQPWDQSLMTNVHSTYQILAKHPFGTAMHVADHYDFIRFFGAIRQADAALQAGLKRFPSSAPLHQRLRQALLRRSGMQGLENYYSRWLQKEDAPKQLEWFAGYASVVAAEFWRRRGRLDESKAAYGRAIERFEQCISKYPETEASSDHWIAMAHAGQARIAFEQSRLDDAVALTLRSFERKQDAANKLDSMNISAVSNARQVLAKLREEKRSELAEKLGAALQALPAELLRRPAFENVGGAGRRGQRRGRGPGRGQRPERRR